MSLYIFINRHAGSTFQDLEQLLKWPPDLVLTNISTNRLVRPTATDCSTLQLWVDATVLASTASMFNGVVYLFRRFSRLV
jgi:hypothetical protein